MERDAVHGTHGSLSQESGQLTLPQMQVVTARIAPDAVFPNRGIVRTGIPSSSYAEVCASG